MSGPRPPRPNEAELVQQSRLKGAEASPVIETGRERASDRRLQQWCYLCDESHDYHAEGRAAS